MNNAPSRIDPSLHDKKTVVVANLILRKWHPQNVLVVGCGPGREAAMLARLFGCKVTGIDIMEEFDPEAMKHADLRTGDATAMEFPNGQFDFVYSYHALEHIPDYQKCIQEMHRVLAPNGGCCVGTPNRSRVIGYVSSHHANLGQKIYRNLNDWQQKIRGRFRNEYGAHAGFTARELRDALQTQFDQVENISYDYYAALYSNKKSRVDAIQNFGLAPYLFPSVYFTGVRR
jgi:ubiquinone/menaquinone biosynthesis C-methylase UbiE